MKKERGERIAERMAEAKRKEDVAGRHAVAATGEEETYGGGWWE